MSDHTTEDIKENEQPATLENNEETERKARIETLIIKSQKLTKLVTSRKEQLYNWRCRLSILRTNNWNSKCQIEEAKRKTNELRETTLKLTAIRDEKAQIFKDLQAEKHKSHTDEWYNVSKRVIDTARLFPNAFHTYSSSQLMKQLNENQKAAIDMTRLVAALSNKLNSSFDAKVLESNKDLKIIKNVAIFRYNNENIRNEIASFNVGLRRLRNEIQEQKDVIKEIEKKRNKRIFNQ